MVRGVGGEGGAGIMAASVSASVTPAAAAAACAAVTASAHADSAASTSGEACAPGRKMLKRPLARATAYSAASGSRMDVSNTTNLKRTAGVGT